MHALCIIAIIAPGQLCTVCGYADLIKNGRKFSRCHYSGRPKILTRRGSESSTMLGSILRPCQRQSLVRNNSSIPKSPTNPEYRVSQHGASFLARQLYSTSATMDQRDENPPRKRWLRRSNGEQLWPQSLTRRRRSFP